MYGKLFQSMYDGTLSAHWEAMVTFQQMIILCDSEGVIDMTPPALARRTGIPLDIIERGVKKLVAPDPYSRTDAEDGRRIVPLDDHRDWGWTIVNHAKYRNLRSGEEIRKANRERKRKQRMRDAGLSSSAPLDCAYCGAPATGPDHVIPRSAGGTDTPDNVVPCCPKCNNHKGTRTAQEFFNDPFVTWLDPERIKANPILAAHIVVTDVTRVHTDSHHTDTDTDTSLDEAQSASGAAPDSTTEVVCKSGKARRVLRGKAADRFLLFWDTFGLKRDKAKAAWVWKTLEDDGEITPETCRRILAAAKLEAEGRKAIEAKGGTPKWAQGWLNDRRWEDEHYTQNTDDGGARPVSHQERQAKAEQDRLAEEWRIHCANARKAGVVAREDGEGREDAYRRVNAALTQQLKELAEGKREATPDEKRAHANNLTDEEAAELREIDALAKECGALPRGVTTDDKTGLTFYEPIGTYRLRVERKAGEVHENENKDVRRVSG